MAKMKWKGSFGYRSIVYGTKDKQLTIAVLDAYIPVSYFSVKGGAKRFIDLTSTDDISLTSEFEQARKLANLKVYLPPGKGFSASDLMDIAHSKSKMSISLFVSAHIGKSLKYTLTLQCEEATIKEKPQKRPVSGTDHLEIIMDIPGSTLLHGTPNRNTIFGVELEKI